MKKNIRISTLLLFAAASLLSGCASTGTGPKYSDVKTSGGLKIPDGKGLVLIYANKVGLLQKYNVYGNNSVITELGNDTFYSHLSTPGTLRLGCKNTTAAHGIFYGEKDYVTLNVEPNETYYVVLRTFPRDNLKLKSKEIGEKEIQNCRWLKPPEAQESSQTSPQK